MSMRELDAFDNLEEYANVLNDEYGEALFALLSIESSSRYLSDEFEAAVKAEIALQLSECREHCKLTMVTRQVTTTQTDIIGDWI